MGVITPHVVRYCAEECSWQWSGELSVANMLDAWRFAHRNRFKPITLRDVLALGRIVEPVKNLSGLRRVGVRVGMDVKLQPELVPTALDALLAAAPLPGKASDATVTEWFRQYEEIHPFVDGNGRTGTLLFNWLRGTLPKPAHVPNLWNELHRDGLVEEAESFADQMAGFDRSSKGLIWRA